MRINTSLGVAIAALTLTAAGSIAPLAAEPLPSAQIAERTAGNQFEFRGRTLVWRFTPDGRVQADYTVSRMTLGGMGEQFGMRTAGTWRRDGDRLCIDWRQGSPWASGCYAITAGRGTMVHLAGPQVIEGSLESVQSAPPAGIAEQPRPQKPQPRGFGR
ncbi:MAG: hypothetical protein ACREIP_08180 [Alphaproteobacteria bacterium]